MFTNAPFRPPYSSAAAARCVLLSPFGKEGGWGSAQGLISSCSWSSCCKPRSRCVGTSFPSTIPSLQLAKYSRHFEGPVPQQLVAAHGVMSNGRQASRCGISPIGPLHSWTSEWAL
ncbi:AP2-associated protein kinase 1-like isoform X1 [Lates japonicus]|uniref:AP2-associated protein kinase 1-like isoform X1 n=1 Tax=Lates japonicus TaxID=270547 RepID=A0AAD3N7B7_LATJO|nr:AP2-associated protein kinase 1-like isoform X1 [Lates japonicus]